MSNLTSLEATILEQIDYADQLEKLYRKNKGDFQRAFNNVYPSIKENRSAQIWNERLNYTEESIAVGQKNELLVVVIGALITGVLAKLPQLFDIDPEWYFTRNIGLVGFPMLIAYNLWKQKVALKTWVFSAAVIMIAALYMNLLPKDSSSDTFWLACIHLPILLWALLGFAHIGGHLKDYSKRIHYLRFNGDFIVMTAVIVLAGILFSGITVALFNFIGMHIENFYVEKIAIWGAASIPIVSTFLVQNNPQLVNKVSPVIAKIFSPMVLVMLAIFLPSLLFATKNVYHDREFLLIFNALLIGVMAIILFAITEATKNEKRRLNQIVLLILSLLTIITNSIALSAIAYRLFLYGFTPNRIAVLGANLLIFVNLILVSRALLHSVRKDAHAHNDVDTVLARFIPLYGIWSALVVFVLPLLFGYK